MDEITIKKGAFGEPVLTFEDTPAYWTDNVYFVVWPPGDPDNPILQEACTLSGGKWTYTIQKGDFDDVGEYYWELAQFEDTVKLEPTCTGHLVVTEGPGEPS